MEIRADRFQDFSKLAIVYLWLYKLYKIEEGVEELSRKI